MENDKLETDQMTEILRFVWRRGFRITGCICFEICYNDDIRNRFAAIEYGSRNRATALAVWFTAGE